MPAYDIRDRSFEFACWTVRFYRYLVQETETPRRVADQLLSAGAPRVLRACDLVPAPRVDPYIEESGELIAIITAIRKNAGHRGGE